MSGISLSGLINGSFDWQSVVTELIQIDSAPITALQNSEATNNTELSAFSQLSSDVTGLQTASQALQADGLFNGVSAASTTPNSTWTATAANGTALGNYTVDVSNLATATSLDGASYIGSKLSPTSNVSGLTLASMPTATAVTAGTFTVDGKQVSVSLSDSLQQVFDAISTATGGNVTGSYDPTADTITLKSGDGSPVVLGAANDTSNFLSAMDLANNGKSSVSSSSQLGAVAVNSPLASAGLGSPVTGTDSSGNGSFSINGVNISYNVNTDTVSSIVADINNSTAGVTASYDPSSDRLILTNNSTGDTGIGVADTTGTLMASLGLTTGSTLVQGQNAAFTVNGGGTIYSASNTLSPAVTGIPGLTIGVNSDTSQTISVAPDTDAMNTAIGNFITAYNTLQTDIGTMTQVSSNVDGSVTTSVLSSNQDVPQWAEDLRNLAFNAVQGVSGTVKSLSDLGIDFNDTSPTLSVTDQTTLTNALTNDPSAVGAFFQTPNTGFAAEFNTYLSNLLLPNTGGIAIETNSLNAENSQDADQITSLQAQLAIEQTNLTNEFLAMQTAQSNAASEEQVLNGMFGGGGSSSSGSSSSSAPASASVVSPSSSSGSGSSSSGSGSSASSSSTA
jgi:flagellar hook-associated protein 2